MMLTALATRLLTCNVGAVMALRAIATTEMLAVQRLCAWVMRVLNSSCDTGALALAAWIVILTPAAFRLALLITARHVAVAQRLAGDLCRICRAFHLSLMLARRESFLHELRAGDLFRMIQLPAGQGVEY